MLRTGIIEVTVRVMLEADTECDQEASQIANAVVRGETHPMIAETELVAWSNPKDDDCHRSERPSRARHVLVTNIQWDTDGMPVDECELPTTVLFLDVPCGSDLEGDVDDRISCLLSDAFGFCHNGYHAADLRIPQLNDRHLTFNERVGLVTYGQ